MKTISLTLRSRDDRAETIAELTWEQGKARVIEATPAIAQDLARLISTGLIEWVGLPGARERRHTLPADPLFLERLADYFARQSGFGIKLVERVRAATFSRVASSAPKQVRGASYMVNRSHEPEVIVRSMNRAAQLRANRTVSLRPGPNTEPRETVYRGFLVRTRRASHMKQP